MLTFLNVWKVFFVTSAAAESPYIPRNSVLQLNVPGLGGSAEGPDWPNKTGGGGSSQLAVGNRLVAMSKYFFHPAAQIVASFKSVE